MTIGDFNRYPYFINETYTVDSGGGVTDVETERWQQWAQVKDRAGYSFNSQAQDQVAYDYEVNVRFDSRFTTNTKMVYEGQVCVCNSMKIVSEGRIRFLTLRYSKTETWLDLS